MILSEQSKSKATHFNQFGNILLCLAMSYWQTPFYNSVAVKSRSAHDDLQVIRGLKLSSESSDYIVQSFIGKGTYSKVARCVKSDTNEMVAVRITKQHPVSEAEEENGILQKLKVFDANICNFVRWNSSFVYKGHLCQVFELLDISLEEYVNMRRTSSLLLKEIRPILHQMATALQALRSLGIAHTKLKPKNIMLVNHVQQPLKVKLTDFDSACDVSRAKQGSYTQPRWYMAPETIMGLLCNEAIDMWSLGCIASELFLGYALYPGCCDYEMIWYITQTQGHLPGYFLCSGLKTSQFYLKTWPNLWKLMTPHEYGCIPCIDSMFSSLDDLKKIQKKPDGHLTEADVKADMAHLENFVELVKEMLQLDPTQRITPSQVLQHPFITMRKLKDLRCPQNFSSDQGTTKEQPPQNQASTRSSFETHSPGNPLLLFGENSGGMVHIKSLEKINKIYANISHECNRSPDNSSFVWKKTKKCVGRTLVKRSYSAVSKSSRRIPETFSPERKRMKMALKTHEKDTAVHVLGSPDQTFHTGVTLELNVKDTELQELRGPDQTSAVGSTLETNGEATELLELGGPDKTSPMRLTQEKENDAVLQELSEPDQGLHMGVTRETNENATELKQLGGPGETSPMKLTLEMDKKYTSALERGGPNKSSPMRSTLETHENDTELQDLRSPDKRSTVMLPRKTDEKYTELQEVYSTDETPTVTKNCEDTFQVRSPIGEMSLGSRTIFFTENKRVIITLDTVEKDIELPELGIPDRISSMSLTREGDEKDTELQELGGSNRTSSTSLTLQREELQELGGPDKTPSVRKKIKICRDNFLVKGSFEEISSGGKMIPSSRRKRIRITVDREESDPELPSTSQEAPPPVTQGKSKNMREEISTSQNETNISRSKSTKKNERKVSKRGTNIWIIGSSYINRGEQASQKIFGPNFGLKAKVQWFGRGGMRWSGVLPRFYAELSTQSCPPDILVIHAGDNDLGLLTGRELASMMKADLAQLHAEFPSMSIAYSCINERQVWKHGRPEKINKDRKTANSYMAKAVGHFDGEIIEHPLLRFFDETIFLADGVHFTKVGNEIFLTSIFYVLKKILLKYN